MLEAEGLAVKGVPDAGLKGEVPDCPSVVNGNGLEGGRDVEGPVSEDGLVAGAGDAVVPVATNVPVAGVLADPERCGLGKEEGGGERKKGSSKFLIWYEETQRIGEVNGKNGFLMENYSIFAPIALYATSGPSGTASTCRVSA